MLDTNQIRRKLLTVFTFPGAPPPTWQWRPCPLLPALLSRSAPSQTGAILFFLSFCAPVFVFFLIIFKKKSFVQEKIPGCAWAVRQGGWIWGPNGLWGSLRLQKLTHAFSLSILVNITWSLRWWAVFPRNLLRFQGWRLTLLDFQQNIDLTNYLDVQTFPDKVELEDWEEVPAWH